MTLHTQDSNSNIIRTVVCDSVSGGGFECFLNGLIRFMDADVVISREGAMPGDAGLEA